MLLVKTGKVKDLLHGIRILNQMETALLCIEASLKKLKMYFTKRNRFLVYVLHASLLQPKGQSLSKYFM